jgi:phage tail sheath gpL-like
MVNIVVPNYPNSNRTPGVFFSVDPSNANTSTQNQKTLIIGQITATGTAVPNVPVIVANQTQLNLLAGGPGSHLARMYNAYTGDDSFAEIWILPVADASGGVANVSTMTITGPATSTGTLSLYVAGQLVSTAVTSADTATVIATNVVAAMALLPSLPATAVAAGGVITFTSRHKGISAGELDLRVNYLGALNGEVLPSGVTVVFATTTPGTVDPTLTTALANLTQSYRFICSPYTGAAQIASLQSLMNDVTGTWSWLYNTGAESSLLTKIHSLVSAPTVLLITCNISASSRCTTRQLQRMNAPHHIQPYAQIL